MNDRDKTQLGKTLWGIADELISSVEYRQAQMKEAAPVDDSELREFALDHSLGGPKWKNVALGMFLGGSS